ncbi:MAG: universal stress protein [Bacteroidales bacterium]|nr:universal stress protein [Bacteroidales bacterium]MDT8432198.1 universal stress protein [Bacteroidales bacterium]
MKTLVTITTVRRLESACFLKEKLEEEAIDCYFVHLGKVADKTDFIKVQVDAEDVETAIRVMMDLREEYGKELEEIRSERFVRKIIVPTDFSRGSENACFYAVHLAEKLQAEIKLLHVYRNPVSDLKMQSNETFENYMFDLTKEEERKAKQRMIEFSGRIRNYMKEHDIDEVFVHSVIAMGSVVRTLKDICRSYKPDLIVLGTQGREEEKTSFFGSVARELVNDLEIPVFAIPGPRRPQDFEMVKILYATDFNENDHSSLNRLLVITEAFKKQITCVHIDTAHNPANEERMDELNEFLKHEYGQQEIRCRLIDYVDVSEGIRDFAESTGANLLSFTIHKRGIFEMLFMPNLFKRILQEASLPILIFPS